MTKWAYSFVLALWLVAPAHAQLYSVIDLGTLGGTFSQAQGISNSGVIAGLANVTGDITTHAFNDSGGVMTDLGTVSGFSKSSGYGINSSGTITVGEAYNGNYFYINPGTPGPGHAFSYSGGVMTDLGTLGGTMSIANRANDSGTMVGASTLAGDTITHAFYVSGGIMTDMGTLGGSYSSAWTLNNAGTIVGIANTTGDAAAHAFSWTSSGGMVDLGTLGGSFSSAFGINSSGTIVGYSTNGSGQTDAFRWTSAGGMVDLGTLGGTFSDAYGLNSAGQIVGTALTAGSQQDAFIDVGGVMTDLNTQLDGSGAGWTLQTAYDINDLGQIVGIGTIGGQMHAFLLVPEPSAIFMLVGGLGLLTSVIRRRNLR